VDRDSYKRRLERFSRGGRIFPGGDHESGNCGCARIITARFGGQIPGYYYAHNPTATVVETDGGHDFALTQDGFIVDPWLYHCYGGASVVDLMDRAEQTKAVRRYGPEENWQRVHSVPSVVPQPVRRERLERMPKAG
jgi:hypothetical protein